MKHNYQTPAICVVRVQQSSIICTSSIRDAETNVGIGYGGSSANDDSGQGARVKGNTVDWDEWE